MPMLVNHRQRYKSKVFKDHIFQRRISCNFFVWQFRVPISGENKVITPQKLLHKLIVWVARPARGLLLQFHTLNSFYLIILFYSHPIRYC